MGFSAMYGALLTKTNRIARIFQSATKTTRRPSYISPKSQLMITLILVSVQFCGTLVWTITAFPGAQRVYPRRDEVILKCNVDNSSFLISQVYNMLLIAVCTYYAIRTRKVPENFNEAKFIGFTMYTTCIIWLAFIPIYFGTGNSFEVSQPEVRFKYSWICDRFNNAENDSTVCLNAFRSKSRRCAYRYP